MKRSEMVNIIMKELISFEDGELSYITHATLILDKIEKAGMLPPYSDWQFEQEGFHPTYESYDYHVWEPEDERTEES